MDIRSADLPLLASLDVLLEERSVTRAAERLHLSQPAVSAQLARLRELLGDPLLLPSETGRGMVPTARALELQQPLRAALDLLRQAVRRDPPPFDPASAARTFRIAGNDNSILMLMLETVREAFQINAHGLKFAMVTPDYQRIAAQMAAGEVDLLVGGPRFMPDSLRSVSLQSVEFRMAQRKRHPRGQGPLTLASYCALRHALVSNEGGFTGFIDELLSAQGMSREVVLSVAQYNLLPPLLAATDLVATLPSRFLDQFADQLDTFALPLDAPALPMAMAWHARSDLDPGHVWLREQLARHSGNGAGTGTSRTS